MKYGLMSNYDEFNYINKYNYLEFENSIGDEFFIDASPTTDILFPNFNVILFLFYPCCTKSGIQAKVHLLN